MIQRLGRLVEQVTSASGDGQVPFVALENIGSRTGSLLPDTELPLRTPDPTGMTAFQEGDVLFGKLRPYLAKSWRADRPGICSTELIVMRPLSSVDGRWLAYLAQSDLLVGWAVATSEGVKMPRTSWEKLRLLEVDAPPIPEQRILADYLDAETARIGALIAPKRSLVGLMFERRLAHIDWLLGRFPEAGPRADIPWLSRVPGDWPSVPLGLLAEVFSGSTPSTDRAADGDVAWTTSGELDQGVIRRPTSYISAATLDASGLRLAPAGSVVVGLVGQGRTRGLSGTLGIDTTLNQNIAAIVPRDPRLHAEYLALLLALAYDDLRNGGRGGNQAALNADLLRSYRIPLASLLEQRRLIEIVRVERGTEERTTDLQHRSIDLLLERRRALITAAVTGQLDTPGVAA